MKILLNFTNVAPEQPTNSMLHRYKTSCIQFTLKNFKYAFNIFKAKIVSALYFFCSGECLIYFIFFICDIFMKYFHLMFKIIFHIGI